MHSQCIHICDTCQSSIIEMPESSHTIYIDNKTNETYKMNIIIAGLPLPLRQTISPGRSMYWIPKINRASTIYMELDKKENK